MVWLGDDGYDNCSVLLFRSINIPQGATINAAKLRITVYASVFNTPWPRPLPLVDKLFGNSCGIYCYENNMIAFEHYYGSSFDLVIKAQTDAVFNNGTNVWEGYSWNKLTDIGSDQMKEYFKELDTKSVAVYFVP